jgi:hypothetical protein
MSERMSKEQFAEFIRKNIEVVEPMWQNACVDPGAIERIADEFEEQQMIAFDDGMGQQQDIDSGRV